MEIMLTPNNECDFCLSSVRIAFSTKRKCTDPDTTLNGKILGYPASFDMDIKFLKCQHFTPDPEKI